MLNKTRTNLRALLICCSWLASVSAAAAQSADEVNKANNPLANMVSLNIQNYYSPSLYGLPDETANTTWLRAVVPVWRTVSRVSLPLATAPSTAGNDATAGIGDLNMFTAFVVTKPTSPFTFGLGPLYQAPTHSKSALGSPKHQLGGAAVALYAFDQIQLGALLTYQHSVAGDNNDPNAQIFVAQPFVNFQLGGGYYLRSTGIWLFDIENDHYSVPLGLGLGKVLRVRNTVINLFTEPQYTVLHKGIGQPQVQIFAGLNFQFITGPGRVPKAPPSGSTDAAKGEP
jgi:hypothetical protein